MTRSKRIRPVVDLAENRQMDAARLLGECRRIVEHQEQRLAELLGYRTDYARNFQESCSSGIGAVKLNEYRTFLGRLDAAIAQQQRLVEQVRTECEASRQAWLQSRTHAKALGNVVDRYRREEQREAERREQKESDEHSARRHGVD